MRYLGWLLIVVGEMTLTGDQCVAVTRRKLHTSYHISRIHYSMLHEHYKSFFYQVAVQFSVTIFNQHCQLYIQYMTSNINPKSVAIIRETLFKISFTSGEISIYNSCKSTQNTYIGTIDFQVSKSIRDIGQWASMKLF